MDDFQFYRPQVNALERLWAQYAEAEGSRGGAFMRGLAPGLEAGLTNIGKNLAAKAEREFQAEQADIKLTAEEKRRRQDEIAANKRLVIGMQSDERIANDRLKAEQAAAAAKRAQGVADATLVFGASGLFSPEESAAFGETVADRGAADAIVENRRAKMAADAENAEKAAAEARIKEAQGIANKTLGELLAFDGITPAQGMAYTARLQAGDPDDMQSVMNELNSLRVDVDARRGALAQFDAFDAEVKKIGQGEGLALPKDTEAFGKAQSLASAAAAKLRDKRFMAAADDNLKRATLNALTDNVFEMRRMIGMVGLGDPEYTAQIAKNYPGLERLAGKNVLFANGRISGDPQQNAQFRKMVDDRLKDDFQLRTELKALGVGDGIDINLLTGNIGAAMPDAAPDIKAQTEKLVLKAKDRLSQQVLEEMGVKFKRVSVPQGYIDVGGMDEAQRTKFGADLRAAAMKFMAMNGRGPTKTEGQQMMADMGYWDINAPTLRKTEPKPKEAPKATEAPKAVQAQEAAKPKEAPKTAQAKKTEGRQDYAVSIGPEAPSVAPDVAAMRAFRLTMPTEEEAKAIAQAETMRVRKMLYGSSGTRGEEGNLLEALAIPQKRAATDRAAIQALAAIAYGTPDPSFSPGTINVPPGGFGPTGRQLPAGPQVPLLQTPGAGAPAIRVPPGGFGSSGPVINVPRGGFTPFTQVSVGGRVMRVPQIYRGR